MPVYAAPVTPTVTVRSIDRTLNRPASDDCPVTLDRLTDLSPDPGDVETAELVVTDDVLVKTFALGPGAELSPHEHDDSTNVFHVLQGTVTVIQDEEEEEIEAPGVVLHERGVVHGARNDTDEVVVFTASLCPLPS
ncbi:Cupin domain-containing protein [Halogranum rubrum]|uniref:Cupin domain-containing protein n=1 Tax=Halogranum rubrum TaxID=553466 RepID=A0A1I4C214_9EURY|nr:Cupin domain-containing protein [Halogranum rubrum]